MSDMQLSREVHIDKHSNMLIIGKANNNYMLRQISYETDYDKVIDKYGDSDLSRGFIVAQEMGAEHIFLMNLQTLYDYYEVRDIIYESDFTYIVPVSIYMSDSMSLPYQDETKVSVIAYLLSFISCGNCESTIIATDKHASLYEDIDSYLDDMNKAEKFFKNSCTNMINGENAIFVANNLQAHKYANAALAGCLCSSDMNEYPTGDYGIAIFNIDSHDNVSNMAYFKNHIVRYTTVENLLNFLTGGPRKIVYVSRIIKMIIRELDFSGFVGKGFNENQRLSVEKQLINYLAGLMNYVIYDYEIISVKGFKDKSNKNTVIIINEFDVWPVNCFEKCHIKLESEI